MSFRLELPPRFAQMGQVFSYLTRLVNGMNYALGFLNVPEAGTDAAIPAEDTNNKTNRISEKSTNTQYPTCRAVFEYAVPQTRTVNGKAMNENITLTPADLGEADYIEASGSNDDWNWRRWHSGAVEMWAHSLIVTMGTFSEWTEELVQGSGSVTYPVELESADGSTVQVQLASRSSETVSEINGIVFSVVKRTTGCTVRVIKKAGVSRIYADIYVRGTAAPVSE